METLAWQSPKGLEYLNQQMNRTLNARGQIENLPSGWTWQPQNEQIDITIGIPHTGVTSIAWAMNLRMLQLPPRVKFICLSGQPIDQARNTIVEQAAGSHIWFLDSDVLAPLNALPRLMSHKLPVVSGLYWRRATPPVPGMYKWFPNLQTQYGMGGHRAILNYNPGELIEADVTGAGCLLVDRKVFQVVPKSGIRDWYIKNYGDLPVNRLIPDGWFYFGEITANQMCVLPDHDVLGGSVIQEIKRGERIYNGNGGPSQVLGTWMRAWQGDVYKIHTRGTLPVTVTPEHELLVLRGMRRRPVYGKTHVVRHINGKRTYIRITTVTQIRDLENATIQKVPASLIKNGDYLAISRLPVTNRDADLPFECVGQNRHKTAKTKIELTDNFGWLMGIYFAEGSASIRYARSKNVQFSFSPKEWGLAYKTQRLLSDCFGLPSSIRMGDHALIVQATCGALAEWLHSHFGHDAKTKHVPKFVLENSNIWVAFIQGIWDGDGYQTHNGPQKNPAFGLNIATKTGAIAIMVLLTSMGIRSSLREYIQPEKAYGHGNKIYVIKILADFKKMAGVLGRECQDNRRTRVDCSFYYQDKLWIQVKKIEKMSYDGLVYDLNIPNGHTYILNGIISGNSEDFAAQHVWRDYGFPTYVATDVECQHVLPFKVGREGFQALDAG